MNGLLFCIFTKTIRQRLYQWLAKWLCFCCCCCKSHTHNSYSLQPSTSHGFGSRSCQFEDTTQYEQEVDNKEEFGAGVAINQSSSTSGQGLFKWLSGRQQEGKGALTSSSQLFSDSVNGYQSLSFGKSVGPEWSTAFSAEYLQVPAPPFFPLLRLLIFTNFFSNTIHILMYYNKCVWFLLRTCMKELASYRELGKRVTT